MTAHAQMMLDACTLYSKLGKKYNYKEADYNLHQAYLALRKVMLHPHVVHENNIITKWRYLISACCAYPSTAYKHVLRMLPSPFQRLFSRIKKS